MVVATTVAVVEAADAAATNLAPEALAMDGQRCTYNNVARHALAVYPAVDYINWPEP